MDGKPKAQRFQNTPVWVRWRDAHFRDDDDGLPWILTDSLGWLLRDDEKCVKIAQSVYPVDENEKPQQVLTIPRAMVEFVRPVRAFERFD